MSCHKQSFLMGLSVGRNLKGWGGSAAAEALAPVCWNEKGIYDRFYIDYGAGLQAFSYGRFCNKTGIFGAAGEILPTDAAWLDSKTVCIYADISAQTRVRVYGNAKAGLTLADGRECPAWAAEFWVDGAAPHELPYAAESLSLRAAAPAAQEQTALEYSGCGLWAMTDTAALPSGTVAGSSESASVAYT